MTGRNVVLSVFVGLDWLALGAVVAWCAAPKQPKPPGKEVPIAVQGPVRLAYKFKVGQTRKYNWHASMKEQKQVIPVFVTIEQKVLRVLPTPQEPKLASAQMQYVVKARTEWSGQVATGVVRLRVKLQSDGKLSDLRRDDGQPLKGSDLWAEMYGPDGEALTWQSELGAVAAAGMVRGTGGFFMSDHLFSLVLPAENVEAGDRWEGSLRQAPYFDADEVADNPLSSLERLSFQVKHQLVGFAAWNGRKCARIRPDYPYLGKYKPEYTIYFDYEKGVLVGTIYTWPDGAKDILWLAETPRADKQQGGQ